MKKNIITVIAVAFLLFGMMGIAQATLITIGTVQFGGVGEEYNLIWDDDNNGNSIVWLDYTNSVAYWENQISWAAGLNSVLTYQIDGSYIVDWGVNSWRLPSTLDGPYSWGTDGTTTAGYNITSSELGHLFYTELGNLGYYDTSGSYQAEHGLNNTGNFDNLFEFRYWSGTEHADDREYAWSSPMTGSYQIIADKDGGSGLYGLAVRTGQVTIAPVPVPSTILLFGLGLLGLAGIRWKNREMFKD